VVHDGVNVSLVSKEQHRAPNGLLSSALVAGPPSPENPGGLPPATV
jgi:hypothetical protein